MLMGILDVGGGKNCDAPDAGGMTTPLFLLRRTSREKLDHILILVDSIANGYQPESPSSTLQFKHCQ